jgi:hypothetical protein
MRQRCTLVVAALLALGAGAGSAATGASASDAGRDDPLQATDCRSALASLQAQETAADGAARANAASGAHEHVAPSVELQAARRLAARNCLASRADPPTPPLRSIQAPIVVAPIAPATAPRPTATVARLPPPVPTPAERPYAVTTCDPGGCWANDGSRLNRIGPNLWGKRGICTLHGSLLQCP